MPSLDDFVSSLTREQAKLASTGKFKSSTSHALYASHEPKDQKTSSRKGKKHKQKDSKSHEKKGVLRYILLF
jgi:hypothetical protein